MHYRGSYPFFDFEEITTFPIKERSNRLHLSEIPSAPYLRSSAVNDARIDALALEISSVVSEKKPVILMMGAHPVKLGLSRLLIELIETGAVTHLAVNGAVSIHDFELAFIGETSEDVPHALAQGRFGMAAETGALMNQALRWGNDQFLGYGESIARMVLQVDYPERLSFAHPGLSLLGAAYRKGIPVTVHASIGTDIIDQHPSFCGIAKGGCVGRDFGVFVSTITRLTAGGVILNVGSAVTMPEVLLKAVSMSANVGCPPCRIVTADFDLRPDAGQDMKDEGRFGYYCRDQKSVVCRIPEAFHGRGVYLQGNFLQTLPSLCAALCGKEYLPVLGTRG